MILCQISSYSNYLSHYGDQVFQVVSYDGDMANICYREAGELINVHMPKSDIVIFQENEKVVIEEHADGFSIFVRGDEYNFSQECTVEELKDVFVRLGIDCDYTIVI